VRACVRRVARRWAVAWRRTAAGSDGKRRCALGVAVLLCSASAACARRGLPQPTLTSLAGDAARVGDTRIPVPLVAAVAASQRRPLRASLDGLVRDAIWAQAATGEGLDREPEPRWAVQAALARSAVRRLHEQASGRGPPTDDELASVRVVHAVVLRSPVLTRARAVAVADLIRRAVASARDQADFETRAKELPHPGAQVKVEALPEFDASGRVSPDGAPADPAFVAGALALRSPGETSAVVETAFGWHVIRLLERRPARLVDGASLEDRRRALSDSVLGVRARTGIQAALASSRARAPVEVTAAADELMAFAVAGQP